MNNAEKKDNNMAQVHELKTKYPNVLVLLRCGNFYLSYGQDAIDASAILQLVYSRATDGTEIAGFPYHALDTYLPKLVAAGRKIAICDMLEETQRRYTELVSPKMA